MPSPREDKQPDPKPRPKRAQRRWPKGGPSRPEVKKFREKLVELRAGIMRSSRNLADEALKSSGQDFSVDHMADHGTDNFEQDVSLSLLEGESELFREIQRAIDKIDGRGELPFGLCESCADEEPPEDSDTRCGTCPWIAKGRLEAVPYARLCVIRQEIEERDHA